MNGGFAESSVSIPWREAFPEFKGNEAGTLLKWLPEPERVDLQNPAKFLQKM